MCYILLLETDPACVGVPWRSCSHQCIPVWHQRVFLFQLILGIPEQALNILHMAIEPVLAHGAVLDKGCAMFLVAKCQVASAASYTPQKKIEGSVKSNSLWNCAQKCKPVAVLDSCYPRVCYLVIGYKINSELVVPQMFIMEHCLSAYFHAHILQQSWIIETSWETMLLRHKWFLKSWGIYNWPP